MGPLVSDIAAGRALRGARNLIAAQVLKFVVHFAGLVVLSRVLGPTAFGIIAIAISVVGLGEYLRDMGLSTAAVRARSLASSQRDALLWTNVSIGVVLALLVFVFADALSAVFKMPELADMLRLLSITFVINGYSSQYRASLNRDGRYSALAVVDVVGPLLGLIVALIFAFSGAGVMSLAAQFIGSAFVSFGLLIGFGRWIPGLPRRAEGMKSLYVFGANYALSQIVGYVGNNIDTVSLGYFHSARTVGLYSRSFQLVIGVLDQLKAPVLTVALPTLNVVRDDSAELHRFLMRGQLLLGYMTMPVAAAMCACAAPVVLLVLGDGWGGAVPIVMALCLAGALQQLATVASWLFVTTGQSRGLRNYTLVSTVIKALAVLLSAQMGPVAVACAYSIATAAVWPLAILWATKAATLPSTPLLMQGFRLLFTGVFATVVGLGASTVSSSLGPVLNLLVGGLGVVAGYALLFVLPVLRSDARSVGSAIRVAMWPSN